ncbi:MAG: glycosyltransferase family 2 protein [Gemmataceae bacterium]|nr:glycosyltransferase family 2 protein [Gemmataceae bacterium]MDW8263858.1 glycosyltransferase family 2 protein [Gemmataceae bacterium]
MHRRRTPPAVRRLSLVIPAYNEAPGIAGVLKEATATLERLLDDFEIIVVDDGSHDDTAKRVADMARHDQRLRLLRHERNRGYGAALRTGFGAARFPWVAFTDADGQFYLDDLRRLLHHAPAAPLVVGYRLQRQDPWLRRFLSWGYNTLVRLLLRTGVRDCDCALKLFRRDVLHELLPVSTGFFVNTEMLARARRLGLRIVEVGVRHRPRRAGSSKVSLRDVPRTLAVLIPFLARFWLAPLWPGALPSLLARTRWLARLLRYG